MKTVISVVSLLACAFSLDAQITATMNDLPEGAQQVKIRNDSAMTVAAYVVSVKQVPRSSAAGNPPFVGYSDPLIDSTAKPLLAGEERMVMERIFQDPSGKRLRTFEGPIVTAGIFADGTTIGDATLLTLLMFRRSSMLLAVETTLETLSDAGRHSIPRDQLIGQFKKMAGSLQRWYLSPEQKIGLGVYQAMIGKLMNLPEGQVGSPFPPTIFVQQETARLIQQRVALSKAQPDMVDGFLISTR